jgi:hypothetical protein
MCNQGVWGWEHVFHYLPLFAIWWILNIIAFKFNLKSQLDLSPKSSAAEMLAGIIRRS